MIILDPDSGRNRLTLAGKIGQYSPDGAYVLTQVEMHPWKPPWSVPNLLRLWSAATGDNIITTPMAVSESFTADGRLLLVVTVDRVLHMYETKTGKELLELAYSDHSDWLCITPDGRFDSSNLDEVSAMHWVNCDEPMRPLPIEMFMRDYYTPQLLSKVGSGQQLLPIRPLNSLNRVQPDVKLKDVREEMPSPNTVTVRVDVTNVHSRLQRDTRSDYLERGVYDVRLFRDGQMVGQWPEPAGDELEKAGTSARPGTSDDGCRRCAAACRPDRDSG